MPDKPKPMLHPDILESLTGSHVMKTPDDLDLMTSEQIDITNILDSGNGSVAVLLRNAVILLERICAIGVAMPVVYWQRAAYEAHMKSLRDDATDADRVVAAQTWNTVLFVQGLNRITTEMIGKKTRGELFGQDEIDLSE